jgi:crotonobetainyl-CoA:carnitine CoA-transferase CaiB-like acyl-CoA transferase
VEYRSTVRVMDDARFGPVRYLAPPWAFSRTLASIERHAPRLGEHTDEILRELGIDAAAIDALREGKAIR